MSAFPLQLIADVAGATAAKASVLASVAAFLFAAAASEVALRLQRKRTKPPWDMPTYMTCARVHRNTQVAIRTARQDRRDPFAKGEVFSRTLYLHKQADTLTTNASSVRHHTPVPYAALAHAIRRASEPGVAAASAQRPKC